MHSSFSKIAVLLVLSLLVLLQVQHASAGYQYPSESLNPTRAGQSSWSSRSNFFTRSRSSVSNGFSWLQSRGSSSSRSSRFGGSFSRGSGCQNKHILGQLVSSQYLTCGTTGWTFPGLIWGDCPITMCIIKTKPSAFGGPMDF